MFAVVYFTGKQLRLHEKDELGVEKLAIEPGKNFKIKEVLLMAEEDGSSVKIGMPFVLGAHIECQVLSHGKNEKIRVFKFKAKKRYQRSQGHRQAVTTIKVLKISGVAAGKPMLNEKEAVRVEKPAMTEKSIAVKKTPTKKSSAKKVASKKKST